MRAKKGTRCNGWVTVGKGTDVAPDEGDLALPLLLLREARRLDLVLLRFGVELWRQLLRGRSAAGRCQPLRGAGALRLRRVGARGGWSVREPPTQSSVPHTDERTSGGRRA